MDVLGCLAQDPELATLTSAELEALAFAFTVRSVADGEALTRSGRRSSESYVLLKGQVSVSVPTDGPDKELVRLEPGRWFGLLAQLSPAKASATCRAVGAVQVGELSRTAFSTLASRHARVAYAFQRAIASQLATDARRLAG